MLRVVRWDRIEQQPSLFRSASCELRIEIDPFKCWEIFYCVKGNCQFNVSQLRHELLKSFHIKSCSIYIRFI